jgi:putative ABC transport system permease protein
VSFIVPLPKRYVDAVRKVPGVQSATWCTWFGGKLPGRGDQPLGAFAVDPSTFFDVYDELSVPEAQRQAFIQDRRGALVGASLARQYGWKLGDRFTVEGTMFPGDWELTVDGIYTAKRRSLDEVSVFLPWERVNESLPPALQEQVGWIASRVAHAREAASVAKRIDEVFESRDIQTLSMSERAVNNSFVGMVSTLLNAVQVVSVVILVIMMLILGNTIAMGVRERTQEYGVLRAIGFLPHHVTIFVLGEATALGIAGGLLAVAVGVPLINGPVGRYLEENMPGFFPYFRVAQRDMLLALALSMLLSTIASLVPAKRAGKLNVIDALRKFG